MKLLPGQILQLNNRRWTLRGVQPLGQNRWQLEAIGDSAASAGMARRWVAHQLGPHLFIEQPRGGYWQAHLADDWQDSPTGPVLCCRAATPLDVLNAHTTAPAAPPNEFSWSYSRDALYRQCPRAYYFHYYAAWPGWLPEALPPVRQVYRLKKLTTIPQWVGTIVHESIKFALARLKAGQPVEPAALVEQLHRRAQADLAPAPSGESRQPVEFQEQYYRANLPPSAWAEALAAAERYLLTFLHSPLYAHWRNQPPAGFLQMETLQSFPVAGAKVWVQLDLARRENGMVYLYDWKTGEPDSAEVERQLGIYGLFARHSGAEGPLTAVVFHLRPNRLEEFELTDHRLAEARRAIEAGVIHLQKLLVDPAANLAEIERFPLIAPGAVCAGCRFRELCGR
jgi:hypothetical protein